MEDDFLRILENLGDASDKGMLLLSGFGEPMQHGKLAAFVKHAKDAGWFCGITTNGTRLSEPAAEGFLDAGLDVLQISLHALTDVTYGRVVKGVSCGEVSEKLLQIGETVFIEERGEYKLSLRKRTGNEKIRYTLLGF